MLNFFRWLKLTAWFDSVDNNICTSVDRNAIDFTLKQCDLYLPSDFMPPSAPHPVETYITLVRGELSKLRADSEDSLLLHPNLTADEISALNELTEKKNSL